MVNALIKNARKPPQDIKVYFCDPRSPWQRIRAATGELSASFLQRVFGGSDGHQTGALADWHSTHPGVLASYRMH